MAYASDEFGFSRPDVGTVARRQLSLSAALLALVGVATLSVAYTARSPEASAPASATVQRVAPSHAATAPARIVTSVRPG